MTTLYLKFPCLHVINRPQKQNNINTALTITITRHTYPTPTHILKINHCYNCSVILNHLATTKHLAVAASATASGSGSGSGSGRQRQRRPRLMWKYTSFYEKVNLGAGGDLWADGATKLFNIDGHAPGDYE